MKKSTTGYILQRSPQYLPPCMLVCNETLQSLMNRWSLLPHVLKSCQTPGLLKPKGYVLSVTEHCHCALSLCQVWLLAGLGTSTSFLFNTCPCDADFQTADSPSCHVLRNPSTRRGRMEVLWSTVPSISCQSWSEVSWTSSS